MVDVLDHRRPRRGEKLLAVVGPHGAQALFLVEDAQDHGERIYAIRDDSGGKVCLLGEEMESLLAEWAADAARRGTFIEMLPGGEA